MSWVTCELDNELATGDKIVELISLGKTLLVMGEESMAEINSLEGEKSTKKCLLGYGIKNFLVARGFDQWIEFIDILSWGANVKQDKINREIIKNILLNVTKLLLDCYEIWEHVNTEVEKAKRDWLAKPIHIDQIIGIPSLNGLNKSVSAFLSQSKCAIKEFTNLIEPFLQTSPPKASRGDTCLITDQKIEKWASLTLKNDILVKFFKNISSDSSSLKHIIHLRNRNEHDHDIEGKLKLYNFRREGDNLIAPMWQLQGEPAYSISRSMEEIPHIMLDSLEAFMILLLRTHKLPWPWGVMEIKERDRNPDKPIRFRLVNAEIS